MKCNLKLAIIAASLWLSNTVYALEAKYTLNDLPILTAEEQHKTASKRITSRFMRSHYKHFKFDDEFSQAIFKRYIDQLDYNKTLFLQSEIDSFNKKSTIIDDELKSGSTKVAYELYNIALKKRFERYIYFLAQLDHEIKFDADDYIEIDRNKGAWPTTQEELTALWQQRLKYDALTLKLTGKSWTKIKEQLNKRYNAAMRNITQSRNEDAFQVYINAFAKEIDPHTSYLSPRSAEQFQAEINLSLEGIGAVLQLIDDYTVVKSLITGGPADKNKQLKEGDRIIGVGQNPKEITDVIGWRLDDVVQLIKGKKGTNVTLEILPNGNDTKSYKITLERAKIRLEDSAVKTDIIERDHKKIGIIEIPGFYVGLTKDTKVKLDELKSQNVDGIIVDLRNNGGGVLSEAIGVTSLFIDNGPILQVRDSYGKVKIYNGSEDAMMYKGPTMVLINRFSASASEIFAAAIQDYQRGFILGENSFGKGTVQQHRSLNQSYDLFEKDLGYIQYTIQKFYRINGGSTQNLGVIPDISYPTPIKAEDTGESVEKNALPWDSINKLEYQTFTFTPDLLAKIKTLHDKRVDTQLEFKYIAEDIAKYQVEKDKKLLSLNEKIRKNEAQKADAKRLERINMRQIAQKLPTYKTLDDVPKDYKTPDVYLDESVAIMIDALKIANTTNKSLK